MFPYASFPPFAAHLLKHEFLMFILLSSTKKHAAEVDEIMLETSLYLKITSPLLTLMIPPIEVGLISLIIVLVTMKGIQENTLSKHQHQIVSRDE